MPLQATRSRREAIRFACTLWIAAFAVGCSAKTFGPYVNEDVPFIYPVGEGGRERWSETDRRFAKCDEGQFQSPIELGEDFDPKSDEVGINYDTSAIRARHDDHTVRLDIDPGNSITFDGKQWNLIEMHFHRLSEHVIDGLRFPLEVHLMHEDSRGNLLILAAVVKFGDVSWPLWRIERNAPTEPGEVGALTADRFSLAVLMEKPEDQEFYHYEGSLTVPPCTEGVQWLVLRQPLSAGMKQQYHFREFLLGNYRRLQPRNDRPIFLHRRVGQ